LAQALANRDTELRRFERRQPPGSPTAPLVVVLSDGFLERHGPELGAVVAGWEGVVVPMEAPDFSSQMPAELKDFSPIFATESEAEIVDDLVLATRVRPEWLAGWRDLLAAARDPEGKPLDRRGLERADRLSAARPLDLIPEPPLELRDYVERSQAAVRRRRRLLRAAGVVVAVILATAAAVAFLQRESADSAAAAARQQTLRAESDRLTRLSRQALASDPDLPVLLARRAYQLLPSAAARESLRAALDATPWHRTYPLPAVPTSVVGSESTAAVVVLGADGSATAIDSRDGHRIAAVSQPRGTGGGPVAAISPDGKEVALAYNGGVVDIRSLGSGFELLRRIHLGGYADSSSLTIAWSGADELLSTWSHMPMARIAAGSGRHGGVRVPGLDDPIAVALSSDGSRLAVANASRLGLFDASTMRRCFIADTHATPESASLTFDPRAERLLLARQYSFATQFRVPSGCADSTPYSSPLVAGSTADLALFPDGAVAVADPSTSVGVLDPPAEYPAAEFPAASGRVTGVAVTAGARLVTVGSDRRLRVWPEPQAPAYPTGPLPLVELSDQLGLAQTRATWRPMMAVTPDGRRITTGTPGSGEMVTVDSAKLGQISGENFTGRQSFNYIGTSIRPIPDHPCRALLINTGGGVAEVECRAGRNRVIWQRRGKPPGVGSYYNSAVSASGDNVAIADSGGVEVTRIGSGASRRVQVEDVRAIGFDRKEDLIAVEGDRGLVEVGVSSPPKSVPIHFPESVTAAAVDGPDGKALLVGSGGSVELLDLESGRRLEQLTLPVDFSGALSAELSRSGRLALIVSAKGYWIIDLARRRLLASGQTFGAEEEGAQPRDAVLAPVGARALYLLRADSGIERLPLARWRFLDGKRLLAATSAAVARRLLPGEAGASAVSGG